MRCGNCGNEELASIGVLLPWLFRKDSWNLVAWHVMTRASIILAVGCVETEPSQNGPNDQPVSWSKRLFTSMVVMSCYVMLCHVMSLKSWPKWILQPNLQISWPWWPWHESHLASIGHREKTSTFMLQLEVLIGKLLPSARCPQMRRALCWDPWNFKKKTRIHPNAKRPASIK